MFRHWLRRSGPERTARIAPQAEWLEPRLLYSADAASLLGVDAALLPAVQQRSLDASFEYEGDTGATVQAAATPQQVRAAYALTPLQFEADAGQLGAGVDFAASGLGYGVRLGGGQAELLLRGADAPVRLELVGADPGTAVGQDLLPTRSNSLVGNDPAKWTTDIANYGSVLYRGVYEGIDVRYYGNQERLEYDFLLAAGADASQLRLRFHGTDDVRLDAHGDLVLGVAGSEREVRFQAPVSYQQGPGGREAVASRYQLQADGTVRIVVGAYDSTRALVVDPVLSHASYLGDSGQDSALGVAIGGDGCVYVTGQTSSTAGAFGTRLGTGADNSESYVAKFSADLTSLLWATRVGGSNLEQGNAIAVDAGGNAVVTGWTRSGDFAVTAGADQSARSGSQLQEAFVYKLNADGNALVFSTYFGSTGNTDSGHAVTLDGAGNIFVAGTVSGGSDNAFLNRYTAAGASVYKLQYGGSGNEAASGIAVDSAGHVYIAGDTLSTDNVTLNGAQPTRPGGGDGFLARYDAAGTLDYATYLGTTKDDWVTGLAADDSGRAYLVGRTKEPSGLATTAGAFATTLPAHQAGYLRIYDTTQTGAASLAYSTLIGGSKDSTGTVSTSVIDSPTGVAVNGGRVAIVGHTDASDFPTTPDAYSRTNTSGDTGFLLVLAPQAGGSNDLAYGTYYGTGLTTGGLAWSGSKVVLVGSTGTTSGLTTADGWQPASGGGGEGVVAMFSGLGNTAPMLSGANDLAAQREDAASSGTRVSDLVAARIADVDSGALAGIAVTAVDSSHGSWQFSTNGGSSWSALASPAAGSGLLLNADAQTRVRFVPAANYAGSSTITFRAWDRTTGSAGTVVAIPRTGGGSAFSNATATAAANVLAVDDAPVRTAGALNPVTVAERTAAVALGLGTLAYAPGGGSDEAVQSLSIVVTGLPGSVGTIQLADGTPVVAGNSYTLAQLQTLRFLAGRTGTATFTFDVKDDGGTANGGQDRLAQSLSLTVTNVAPVLSGANPMTWLEDLPGDGVPVSDLVAGKVTDGGGAWGIAVVGMPAGDIGGTWQYSVDGGTTWLALGGTPLGSRLLGPDARVRFVGDAGENVNGAIPGFTFRAWDGSSGASGGLANTATVGGTTAFSTATATASPYVTPVNDIPVRFDTTTLAFLPAPADVTVTEGTLGTTSLGLGYLEYVPGYAYDEYYDQTLSYAVTGLPTGIGTVFLADGTTAVTAGTSYSLAQIQGMRFKPGAGVQSGSGLLTWSVKDDAGTANGGVDTLVDQVRIVVRNVAPTLAGSNAMPSILEDAQSAGMLVSDLVRNTSNTSSIAVTAADGAGGGIWQWTSDGGSTWNSLAGASTANAVLLAGDGQWRVRFLPSANWNSSLAGTAPGITLRAWDRSSGTAGATADATLSGGSTPFSATTATATISVTPVNDAPLRADAPGVAFSPLVLLDGSPRTSLGLGAASFGPGGAADESGQTVFNAFTITSLPSGLGTVWTDNGATPVTLGANYTLAQIRGMQFLSSGIGALGTENFSFTARDSGGTANGGADTATFTVKVIVNRAPVLNGANSPLGVQEDFGGNGNAVPGQVPSWATPAERGGVLVSQIVSGKIVDTTGSPSGIAVIGKVGGGTWQYTTDGGTTWTNIPVVANDSTLLLAADAATSVRFVPDPDWNSDIGTASITFRAWDQSTGIAGQFGDATYNGGASAYSASTATSVAAVTARNDAPAALDNPVGGTVAEGDPPVGIIASGSYGPGPLTATDEAGQAVTVTFPVGLPAGIELLKADGSTPVSANGTYTLAEFLAMKFRSAPGAVPGAWQLDFRLRDDGGTGGGSIDRATLSLTLTVTNRAPVLYGANAMTGILEDSPDDGTLVSALVAGQVADPTGTRGIAVTGVDNSHGTWQYTRDGGATWSSFGTPGAGSARLLLADANTRVRFVPAVDWSGSASLDFIAWDGTSGSAGGVANASVGGAGTAFSLASASTTITVSPVNDAPVGGVVADLTVAEDSGSTSLGLGGVSYGPGGGGYEAGQQLTYQVTVLPAAALGRITLADGTAVAAGEYTIEQLRGMRFVTAANAVGTTSFGFEVHDDGGGTDTLVQAVAITLSPVNDAPVAGFDTLPGSEDTQLAIAPAALLANDTDVDGDALAITSVTSGGGGTVVLSGGNVVFTPDADFNGMASFSYTVSDGQGGTSITGVVVSVAPVNDAPVAGADAVAGTEDQPLTIAPSILLGNDTDVDGDGLTVSAVTAGAGGTVTLSGGNVVFTPNANFNGEATFTYTVSDGQDTAIGTVTVTVAPVNDPLAAHGDTVAGGTEDTPLSIDPATLLANDTDIDGDTLVVTGVANGTGGTVALVDDEIVFTPAADFNGDATFSYTATDGHGASSTATVTVKVAAANDAPVANGDAVTATADTPLVITPDTLLANDADLDGDGLSIIGLGPAVNGSVAFSGGDIVFTPSAGYTGSAGFTYTVSDGHGGTAIGTVDVTVVVGNEAPVAVADSRAATEDTPVVLDASVLLANDSDPDGDTLVVTGVTAVTGGTVDRSGTTITFTPTPDFNGPARFTYTVSDGNGGTASATVTLNFAAVNDAPVANDDAVAGTEDQVLTITPATLLGNDTDVEGHALAITDVAAVSGGSVTLSGGNVVFTPDADFNGDAIFRYTVEDADGGSATGTVTVVVAAVNDPPAPGADTRAGVEDQVLTITPATLLANDADVEGDALTVTGVANGSGGTVALSPGGDIVFTPAANFNGNATFRYTVSDGHGGTGTAVVTVVVTAANDAPVANGDAVSGTEDQPLTITPASLLANDSDLDGDTLTVTGLADAVGGTVAFSGGNIVFTPTANFSGAGSFSYTVSDGHGGTATATVAVTVAAVNDAPAANADAVDGTEDQVLTLRAGDLLANDGDLDADTLSITAVSNALGGTVVLGGTDVVFTPTANFHGTGGFRYTVSDGHGGTATATVTLNLLAANDAPVAGADGATTAEDTPLVLAPGALLANDGDVDLDTLTITDLTAMAGGSVAWTPGGDIVFTPEADFNGTGRFSYTVSDGHGGTATATVTVVVTPVNDAPVAGDDTVAGGEDTLLVIAPETLLANDGDAEDDTLSIVGLANGSGGTVAVSGTAVVFTPTANFTGTGSFTYTLSDGHGGTSTATVTVEVAAANDAPVAHADVVAGTEDTPVTIAPATLLANDSDIEGDALTITGVASGAGGTVALAGGSILFTPTADFNGPARFTYTIADGHGGTAVATVTINVAEANDPPVARGESATTAEDTPLTIDPSVLLANDSDVDADTLAVTGVASGSGGVVELVGGKVVFTPDPNFNGSGSFRYTVSDGHGGTATATVSVTVMAENDAPAATADTVATGEDQPLTILTGDLLANDGDVEDDALTIAGVTAISGGTVTLSGGSIVFTPGADFNGNASFRYTVVDGNGGTSTAVVTVQVAPLDDATAAAADRSTVAEDGAATGNVLANDTDVDSALAVASFQVAGDATVHAAGTTATVAGVGTVTIAANGDYTFTPVANWNGSAPQVSYTTGTGASAVLDITVTPADDPTVPAADTITVAEDSPATGNVLANDTDVDSPLAVASFRVAGDPAVHAAGTTATVAGVGSVTLRADGTFTFTPLADWNGIVPRVSYTTTTGAASTLSVRVSAVDDATVTAADGITVAEDSAATGNVLANDADVDDALAVASFRLAGDATVHGAGATVAIDGVGSITLRADGSYTFAPAAGWSGAVPQLTYTTTTGASATLGVSVTAVDDPTLAQGDAATVAEDGVAAGNVLANDADADDTLAVASFRVAGDATVYAAGATATIAGCGSITIESDGSFAFTPARDWNGWLPGVSYTTATGATQVLAIRVSAVNDAPEATGLPADLVLVEGASASLGLAGIGYDVGGGADEAATQHLAVTLTALPGALGTVTLGDGTAVAEGVSYTVDQLQGMVFHAAAGVSGSAALDFTISDGAGARDSLAQHLTLTVRNQAPVLLQGANELPAIQEDEAGGPGVAVADLLAGQATDPSGRIGIAVTAAAAGAGEWQFSRDGANWTAFDRVSERAAQLLPADARIRFVPAADWSGTAAGLAFRAWDGSDTSGRGDASRNGGASAFSAASASVAIVVQPVNDAPHPMQAPPAQVAVSAAGAPVPLPGLDWTYSAGGGSDEATQSVTIVFTSVPAAQYGRLVLADGVTSVVTGTPYTPQQLRGLQYLAAPSGDAGTVDLQWVAQDDGGTAHGGTDQTPGSVRIAVTTQPGTPVPVPTEPPAPPPPVVVAPPPPPAAPPPAAPPAPPATPAPAPAPVTRPGGGAAPAASAPTDAAQAPAYVAPSELVTTLQRLVEAPEPARSSVAMLARAALDLQLVSFNPQSGGEFQVTGFADFDLNAQRLTLEQFQQSLRSGVFIEELNRMREQLREEFDLDRTLSISVAGLSLGVSVAYVLWLVRGGVLLGSYLSALPAWRLLDPLPVLARPGEDADDDDDTFEPDPGSRPDPLRGFS